MQRCDPVDHHKRHVQALAVQVETERKARTVQVLQEDRDLHHRVVLDNAETSRRADVHVAADRAVEVKLAGVQVERVGHPVQVVVAHGLDLHHAVVPRAARLYQLHLHHVGDVAALEFGARDHGIAYVGQALLQPLAQRRQPAPTELDERLDGEGREVVRGKVTAELPSQRGAVAAARCDSDDALGRRRPGRGQPRGRILKDDRTLAWQVQQLERVQVGVGRGLGPRALVADHQEVKEPGHAEAREQELRGGAVAVGHHSDLVAGALDRLHKLDGARDETRPIDALSEQLVLEG